MVAGAYSREFLSVLAVCFVSRNNGSIRLQEPTEAMRLPQMNTCYSALHRLCWRESERERRRRLCFMLDRPSTEFSIIYESERVQIYVFAMIYPAARTSH